MVFALLFFFGAKGYELRPSPVLRELNISREVKL